MRTTQQLIRAEVGGALSRCADLQERLAELASDRRKATEIQREMQGQLETLRSDLHAERAAAASAQISLEAHEDAAIQSDVMGDIFLYNARGARGAAPRHIFDAEPQSTLRAFYCGAYVLPQDDDGYVFINLPSQEWHAVLDWLTYGAVPQRPSSTLCAFAEYWNMQRLLEALHLESVGFNTQSNPAGNSFVLEALFRELPKAFSRGRVALQRFTTLDRTWELTCNQGGVFLALIVGTNIKLRCRFEVRKSPNEPPVQSSLTRSFEAGDTTGWGFRWVSFGWSPFFVGRDQGDLYVKLTGTIEQDL